MSTTKYMSYDNLHLYDENIKKYINENFAKQDEPIFTGDIIVDGEIKATNVPHTISETILCVIPASTIRDLINSGNKALTVDAFTHNPDIIVYANYGGFEYACITNTSNHIEFFIADPYVTDGFACVFEIGKDANDNVDETKCKFTYRVLETDNITDLIISQLEVSYIDSKYFDHDLTIINSLSMNRRGSAGVYSTALGSSCKATGNSSFATGLASEATAPYSTAVGKGSFATGEAGLSSGLMTTAGREAFSSGRYSQATGRGSLATGNTTIASGQYSVAEGQNSIASKTGAHAEGNYTLASSTYQHTEGKFNIEDTASVYAHIVGNGTSNTARSNAHTLDWKGNAEYAGDVVANGCGSANSPVSLVDVNNRTSSLEAIIEEIQDITSEEIQALFVASV